MIGVSKLLLGAATESDGLRYRATRTGDPVQISYNSRNVKSNKPIVVWNMTKQCNLKCMHCYASATSEPLKNELTTDEGKGMLEDISKYGCPVVLFSGGEPFMRKDLIELAEYADTLKLRPVISTNGTLITKKNALAAKKAGVKYIGVSLDGLPDINDKFRGVQGAFNMAITGMKNTLKAKVKTGLRFTLTRYNNKDLPDILLKLKDIGVNRCCVYHLDYSGRGKELSNNDLPPQEWRKAVTNYFELTQKHHHNGYPIETLLVGNYCDAGFIYLYLLNKDTERAELAYKLLKRNNGDGTGETISCVDFLGNVHANQFWHDYSFGNVKDRYFGDIWEDISDPIMKGLKNKERYIKGRCAPENCRFFQICKGGSRTRALAITGDVWEADPACYLTDDEIKIE